MMEQLASEEEPGNLEGRATELLWQAEHCARAGLLPQAFALLSQVWETAHGQNTTLASITAWEAAWLLMGMGKYRDAAAWFDRAVAPPASGDPLRSMTRRALVQLCQALISRSSEARPPVREPAREQAVSPTRTSPHPPPLDVTNLGHFQLARAGKALPACKTRKAIAIFRYLLTRRDRAAHKDELMDLFWTETPPREASHSLHVAVSSLRRHLDPPTWSYLLFEAGYYRINPNVPVEDDCATFEWHSNEAERWWEARDLHRAQLSYLNAVTCYQGDYNVDELELTWAIAERERLLARYLVSLDRLGQLFIAQGHYEPAIEHYQRLVERDGYREDAHSQLMRCYWHLGRRGEALRQYERCAELLARDLGLEPMQEIRALYRTIASADVSGDRQQPATVYPFVMRAGWGHSHVEG